MQQSKFRVKQEFLYVTTDRNPDKSTAEVINPPTKQGAKPTSPGNGMFHLKAKCTTLKTRKVTLPGSRGYKGKGTQGSAASCGPARAELLCWKIHSTGRVMVPLGKS